MEILRESDSKTSRGPVDWFFGEVWMRPILGPGQSPSLRSTMVSFNAGTRTAWHTHPRGQMICVLSGTCHARKDGGELQTLTAGDVAWFAPNEKHWHGAAPGHPMVHLAVQEADENGETVVWLEHVHD